MGKAATPKRHKLLFVVTEDWYFCSHRLPLAIAAINAGFDVAIATRVAEHGDVIRSAGIEIHPWDISRGSTSILSEIRTVWDLLKIFRKVRPDIVHQVALKPVLYGSLIAKFLGTIGLVNALGGMGSVVSGEGKRNQRLKQIILTGFKWILSGKDNVLILQNPEDVELMIRDAGVHPEKIRLIRGAGVNIHEFNVEPEPVGTPLVILPARMLWDKGIGEFVEAARILQSEDVKARFALVGGIDECNPSGINIDQIKKWTDAGIVEWFGKRTDMPAIFKQANIVCLPSYREGLPKALLEAAASGRAIVATNVPGCKEIVKDGESGLLVPAKDAIKLAEALKTLILNSNLRHGMGMRGREMVLGEFSEDAVVINTISIYKELVG